MHIFRLNPCQEITTTKEIYKNEENRVLETIPNEYTQSVDLAAWPSNQEIQKYSTILQSIVTYPPI
jgi:hypothetical protein